MPNKFLVIIPLFLTLFYANLFSQQNYQDVVYLKNGSIIHGIIIEQIIGKSIKIQASNNDVLVFSYEEVERIIKEPIWEKDTNKSPNGSEAFKKHSGGKKSPGIAFVLSLIVLPGAGQVYNGESGKGIEQFFLVGMGYSTAITASKSGDDDEGKVNGMAIAGLVLAITAELWSVIDAPLSASRINEERGYSKLEIPRPVTPAITFSPINTYQGKIKLGLTMTLNF
jgi:hypothetical protein